MTTQICTTLSTKLTSAQHPVYEKQDISFSSTHGTFTKTDQIMGHQTILNKFKSFQVHSRYVLVSDYNEIRLEINNRKISEGSSNI